MAFFLSNGENIDLSRLKAGLVVNANNEFLKKYDTNNNSIFEQSEIDKLKSDITSQDTNGDCQIDRTEAIAWAKVLGIAQNKINKMFSGNKNAVDDGLKTLVSEQTKSDAASTISRDADTALDIYFKSEKESGKVAKEWNNFKQLAGLVFNVKYAGNKVYRQLVNKKVTGVLLEEAQKGGLSNADYINIKIGLLINFLGANNISQKELNQIKESILNMELSEIETLTEKLCNAEDAEYEALAKQECRKLINQQNDKNTPTDKIGGAKIKTPARAFLESGISSKKISFEQVFKKEMGINYYEQAVRDYSQKEQEVQLLALINNRITSVNQKLSQSAEKAEAYIQNCKQNGLPTSPEEYTKLNLSVLTAMKEIYGNDENRISSELTKLLGRNIQIKNGLIDIDNDNYTELISLAKKVQNSLTTRLKNMLGDKTIEQYQQELKDTYAIAYGAKNPIDLAKGYAQDQKDGVTYAKFGAQSLGFGIMLVSGGSLLAAGAGVLAATGGSIGISALEAYSKQGGASEEDKAAIKNELTTALKLLPAGFGVGMAATKISAQFTSKAAQLITNYGSDLVMSVLVDMSIMGDVDLSAESISELMNIFMGIATHNKVKNKTNTHQKTETSNINSKSDKPDVFVCQRDGVDGYVVKIGEEEFVIKDLSELGPLLEQKAQNAKKVDMSGIKNRPDVLAKPTVSDIPPNIKQSYSQKSINNLTKYLCDEVDCPDFYMKAIESITQRIKNGETPSLQMLNDAVSIIKKHSINSTSEIKEYLLESMSEIEEMWEIVPLLIKNAPSKMELQAVQRFRAVISGKTETNTAPNKTNEQSASASSEIEKEIKTEASNTSQKEAELKAKEETNLEKEEYQRYSEKYPDIFEKLSDDKSAIALSKVVESYNLKMSYDDFDPTQIYQKLSNAGIKETDWDKAFNYIKNKFHRDVIEIEQRVEKLQKPLGKNDNFTLSKENARIVDLIASELKAKEAAGIKITEQDIDMIIESKIDDARMPERIKQRLFNMPELQKYLNENLHLNIINNPKYTSQYNKKDIEDAIKIFDILKQDAKQGTLNITNVQNAVEKVKAKNLVDNKSLSQESLYALQDIISDDPQLSVLCKDFIDQIEFI